MKKIYTLIAASLITAPAMAQLSNEAGFSGEVSINSALISSTSNLNTDGNSTLSSLNQNAPSNHKVLVAPLGSLAYTFGESLHQQVYVGTTREDIATGTLVLEVGYKHQLKSGTTIDASVLPTIMSGDTWQDPYLIGQARQKTNESGNAFRVKFDNIAGSAFSVDTAYATRDVENDKVHKDLQRDSKVIYLKGKYRQPLSRTSLIIPSLTYMSSSADGSASSYEQFGAELSLFKAIQKHQFVLTAGYHNRTYDANHPVYQKTRSDNKYNLFAAYEYAQFMNWDDWSFIALAGYGNSQSNIAFHDEAESLVSMGLNYKF